MTILIDDVRLPEQWSKGSAGGLAFMTSVVPLDSGDTDREERWEHPLWRGDIAHNIKTPAAIIALRGFHAARRGASRGFLLKDWVEYTSAADGVTARTMLDQPLGTGDGADTTFQLVKRYTDVGGTYDRPIRWPVTGTLKVAVNGVEKVSGVAVDRGTGTVTLTPAPALAAVITAGFEFDIPVRFEDDHFPLTWDSINSRSAGQMVLEEVRKSAA